MYRLKLISVFIAAALILAVVGQVNVPVAAQTEEPVVWAFVPSENSQEVLASADAIAALVTEKTNIPIKTFVATEFAGVIEAMCNGQAQMGALNTFGYVLASSRECADVSLVSVRNGSTSYRGQIITLATSGIKTIADLKGKTFCRPDPLSTSGWIIPSILLKANGIDTDVDLKVTDVGGHDAVVENVYNGNCDAGATFDDARGQVADKYPDVLDKVVVIDYSAAIPNDTVSFTPAFDADKRAAITTALLEIVADEKNAELVSSVYNWTGLAEAKDAFFDDFRQQLDSAGVTIDQLVPTPAPATPEATEAADATTEATAEATAEATP